MLDYAEPQTPVVMASEKGDYQVASLISLFPHPLPYLGLKGEDVKELAEGLVEAVGRVVEGSEWFSLYEVSFFFYFIYLFFFLRGV